MREAAGWAPASRQPRHIGRPAAYGVDATRAAAVDGGAPSLRTPSRRHTHPPPVADKAVGARCREQYRERYARPSSRRDAEPWRPHRSQPVGASATRRRSPRASSAACCSRCAGHAAARPWRRAPCASASWAPVRGSRRPQGQLGGFVGLTEHGRPRGRARGCGSADRAPGGRYAGAPAAQRGDPRRRRCVRSMRRLRPVAVAHADDVGWTCVAAALCRPRSARRGTGGAVCAAARHPQRVRVLRGALGAARH